MSRRFDPYIQMERQRAAAARRAVAEARAQEASRKHLERMERMDHVARRLTETEHETTGITEQVTSITELLGSALAISWPLDFTSLQRSPELPVFDPQGQDRSLESPRLDSFLPLPLSFLAKLVPGAQTRHAAAVAQATADFAAKQAERDERERQRQTRLAELRAEHEAECSRLLAESDSLNKDIAAFESAYGAGEPQAVVHYCSIVLERDPLPDRFPHESRIAMVSESKQLVVERQVPGLEAVPTIAAFRFVKSRDTIETTDRPVAQIRILYAGLVAQMALRTLHGLFASDRANAIASVVVNLVVETIDPSTGRPIRPCLLTVRADKQNFLNIDLSKVEPLACLRGLGAQVSSSPHELHPVRPLVDFNMVDHRFIATPDVLALLDQRPNLADLTPSEFEGLITNLFSKMGLETRLTQASRDGGVDCVAWDMRPVVGGKVIVQAKRYKHTVGVSAVRDLYGTVMNEGAAKGILVTTSGYGKSAYDFATNKPLELLTGSNLLYLLEEHTGVKAKIDFPEEWIDPVADGGQEPPAIPESNTPISIEEVRRGRSSSG